jgi:hypothetical protein
MSDEIRLCPDCVADILLGTPSRARWLAPYGDEAYCSMHFIRRFGHNEPLRRIEGYEPPPVLKAPAPPRPSERQKKATEPVVKA